MISNTISLFVTFLFCFFVNLSHGFIHPKLNHAVLKQSLYLKKLKPKSLFAQQPTPLSLDKPKEISNANLNSNTNPNKNPSSKRHNTRRKMAPPQRKIINKEDSKPIGRVSVYCVGSEIDLASLRAHIFRRGFHRQNDGDKSNSLTLTRRPEGPEIDDGMLHVSNAPLIYSEKDIPTRKSNLNFETNQYNPNVQYLEDNQENVEMNSDDNSSNKAKEMLVMTTQDIFYFEYGCVVFWGLSSLEEKAALEELQNFTIESVTPQELEDSYDTMEYIFDRTSNPSKPVKFDRIKLRSDDLEEKLALSYAMAQSSKLFVFENKVLQSVERTRFLPKELAREGKISCSKKELNRLIGQLFVQQTEVNLFSSILDTPDFLWDDDEYFPTYDYIRSYLEVNDRVSLLNNRLSVIRELLDVLTAQIADNNSTRLEWIVIWLITLEIGIGIASNKLFAGKRILAAMLIPLAIALYKKFDWFGV